MTTREAADYLGCSISAVRKAIARGLIPVVPSRGRYGIEYHVSGEAVERYRQEHLTPRKVRS